MSTYQPFIYIIGWTDLNIWYIGARYARETQPIDLWTTYFTSSKHVEEVREHCGEPDYFESFVMPDHDVVRTLETAIIKEFELHKNTRWLNKGCFKTYHASPEERSEMMKRHFEDPAALERNRAKRREVNSRPEIREMRRQSAERLNSDPSYKKSLSDGQKRRWSDADRRAEFSLKSKEFSNRPEEIQARKDRAAALWADPVYREKISARVKESWEKRRLKKSSQ
jgi:hypothetical protein